MAEPDLGELQRVWEAQARADPLWAILSEDSRRRRGWDLPSFLATGERFVHQVLARFSALGYEPRGSALDFGCGVGRLTQPLGDHFERVLGVDISPTMVAAAQRINRHGDRVRYVVNDRPDLAMVPSGSIDFVMSFITLQHIPPDAARAYLADFVRILRPGGLLFFQLPSHRNDALVAVDEVVEPVPAEACVAAIHLRDVPGVMVTRQTATVVVTVENRSRTEWISTSEHPLRVGNHWIDESGRSVVHDDGRAGLPARMPPGATATVELSITAPDSPGPIRLVIDVVQEGVRWFESVGGSCWEQAVEVEMPRAVEWSAATEVPSSEVVDGTTFSGLIEDEWFQAPTFEMHGIPRAEVERSLAEAGVRVLDAELHVDDWVSFAYYAVADEGAW